MGGLREGIEGKRIGEKQEMRTGVGWEVGDKGRHMECLKMEG